MSAWVIALGLSAGYLMTKNLQMQKKLDEQIKIHHEQAEPAKPGPTTERIRDVQRTVPDADKYQDMNIQDIDRERVKELTQAREQAHQEVAAFEQGPPPIQGVWLNFGDRGLA
ncbi:MAG: hypothetical protein CMO41_04410 [Verrucomicrobiales bacterium]|mgnify:CR=1 FL=1|nr:hypothetical protein [Verrucomicrobiales bacterium]|tara:strand:+ start:459 stop:797 length:339 start_codon:yes stop_codon:yes gene_type:complete